MFKWLWRKQKSELSPTASPRVAASIGEAAQTVPTARADMTGGVKSGASAQEDPTAAMIEAMAIVAPKSAKTVSRLTSKSGSKQRLPTIGMAAKRVAGKSSTPVAIVAVQANGRKILAKAAGETHVRAFTLRADRSYRLDGAPDRSEPKVVL